MSTRAVSAQLFVKTGPRGGEIFPLAEDPVLVGRGKDCGMQLDDPFVSRRHFRVEFQDGAYWVQDMGSSNRISVNGLPQTRKKLHFGDEIRVGSTVIVFTQALPAASDPAEVARELTRLMPSPNMRFDMVGSSPAMTSTFKEIQIVARHDVTVLITGESGTGKELVARAIHRHSPRAKGPLVAINCAAISRELMESELFGHEKGAFTGAHTRRLGKFELAHDGTLFLDEIGDLSLEGQAKLLRALEDKRITRLGGQTEIQIDVRFLAATNRDLKVLAHAGKFRSDLLFRLEASRIKLPPLRERKEDIPDLARHFLIRFREEFDRPVEDLSEAALQKLMSYAWPGNVRELENVVRRAVLFGEGTVIPAEEILFQTALVPATQAGAKGVMPMDELIHNAVCQAMDASGGNKKKAAELLGIPRTSLHDLLKKSDPANH